MTLYQIRTLTTDRANLGAGTYSLSLEDWKLRRKQKDGKAYDGKGE